MNRKCELGIIEGFYGEPWSWDVRKEYAAFLKNSGYTLYFYAPKADAYFRKKWREPMPRELEARLRELIGVYHDAGLEFGVGFTPYEAHLAFDSEAKSQLLSRIELFNSMGIDRLAILLDDMKGAPGLAQKQAEILRWVGDHSKAKRLAFCPTYYSLDPILDRLFGERDPDYLSQLGRLLDAKVDIFWTGEKVCSPGYTEDHLKSIGEQLGRPPLLWDNYPVNDGPKMCKFIHIDAFQNRPASLAQHLSGHIVNPMNQPWASRIPLLTLAESYRSGTNYDPKGAFSAAGRAVGGPELTRQLERDLELLARQGLDTLDDARRAELIRVYSTWNHPLAQEVVSWLHGKTVVTRDVFLTQ